MCPCGHAQADADVANRGRISTEFRPLADRNRQRAGGASAAGDRAHDHEGLDAAHHRLRQQQVEPLERQVVLAGEEAQERPPFLADVIADGALQQRIPRFDGIEDSAERDGAVDGHFDLAADAGERLEMLRELDADHGSVCTSTESTDGRSRAIGAHVSPESADAYTWPPVVPKSMPH